MHFDENAVGAGGDRGASHRRHLVAQAGAVTRVGDHRQMRQSLHQRDGRQVEQVARHRVEAANAALAEDHLIVALGEDVFGAHQQVDDRRRHAALEQHRLLHPADGAQQGIVLHVARADLNAVGVFGDEIRALFVERFSVTIGRPVSRRASASISSPFLPSP